MPTARAGEGEDAILRTFRRLDHIDDPERVGFYFDLLARTERPRSAELAPRERRMLAMLLRGVGVDRKGDDDLDATLARLWPHQAVRDELCELFVALAERSTRLEGPLDEQSDIPVALHAEYTRSEVLLAFGDGTIGAPSPSREGVRWLPEIETDLLFVTLRKSERSFSPSTMYRDYAISRTRFHWESQNATHDGTPTGQRYVEHAARGTNVVMFVRDTETRENGSGAPFTCLGPVRYVSHESNRPMQVTWELAHPLPEALLETSQMLAAA